MKRSLYAGVAIAAMSATGALAGSHLPFSEADGQFSWDSYRNV